MRTLFFLLVTASTLPALATKPAPRKAAPVKWECLTRGAETKPFAVVEAADQAKADDECKAAWGRLSEAERNARPRRGNDGVSDGLFSKRMLER